MPFATIDNTRVFYRLEGNAGRPVIVLSHSIGCDLSLWAQQVPDLLQHFQVLRYDTRGHGASDAPKGDYSIERLGRDVLGLVDALGISKFAFCGLSLGGMIGQWLGANAGERRRAISPEPATGGVFGVPRPSGAGELGLPAGGTSR